ncbi:MAG: endolytic transglycosylase MltG [Sulfobacillus acidophilus]|uniref:Endolytic murein transglycosylase n=1 Tax=Sulfobacillus acidophilus TaxID=53633 RepID=A0A2T2WPN8_9FIRM|nr:MAG: endolytic transglycosylase MltG [Sulfobacillus acidophilus]
MHSEPAWWKRRWLWRGAVALGTALFVVAYVIWLFQPANSHARATKEVRVSVGQTASDVAANLQRRGIIRSAWAFELLSRYDGVATHLTAGVYRLSPAQSLSSILTAMRAGDVVTIKVAVPEGFTVHQIVERLIHDHIGTWAQYRRLQQHPLKGMPSPRPGVRDPWEGYLFPATYAFAPGTTARQAVVTMWQTFHQRVVVDLYDRSHTPLTLVQWVTLASIVQQEAKESSQGPKVAAVFLNRLKLGMPFQSDATVRYALGKSVPNGLTLKDLTVASPYNTYIHKGFPPGPIANPGLAMLKAALHPASVPYLYFVSLRSGRLLFATTLAQHDADIAYAKKHPNA